MASTPATATARTPLLERRGDDGEDDEDALERKESFWSRLQRPALILLAATTCIALAIYLGEFFLQGNGPLGIDPETLERAIEEQRLRFGIKGASVGVVVDGKVVFAEGFGVRDRENEAVSPATLFQIGSTTKAFTAFLAATAVQELEGKLNWTTPVSSVFNITFKDKVATEEATLIDLLSHRTGIPRHDALQFYFSSPDQILRKIPHLVPTAGFRELFQYNNHMYTLAGLMIAQLTKAGTWAQMIRDRVFDRLGMKTSVTSVKDALTSADHAHGYYRSANGTTVQYPSKDPFVFLPNSLPAGGIWSNAVDMCKWMNFFLNETRLPDGTRVLSKENYKQLITPYMAADFRISFALGWALTSFDNRLLISHNGAMMGYSSGVFLFPAEKKGSRPDLDVDLPSAGIIILNNQEADDGGMFFNDAVAFSILSILTGRRNPWAAARAYHASFEAFTATRAAAAAAELARRKNDTVPSRPLTAFVGTYKNSAYGRLRIRLHEVSGAAETPRLRAELDPDEPDLTSPALGLGLKHWQDDEFVAFTGMGGAEFVAPTVKFWFEGDAAVRGRRRGPTAFAKVVTDFALDPESPFVVWERAHEDEVGVAEMGVVEMAEPVLRSWAAREWSDIIASPAFQTYATTSTLLLAKAVGLGVSTVVVRLWTNSYGTSEDRFWPWILNLVSGGRWAPTKTITARDASGKEASKKELDVIIAEESGFTHPVVKRVSACHSNDTDNTPALVLLGAFYLFVAKPSPEQAKRVFWSLVAARYSHTVSYALGVQPFRGAAFLSGSGVALYMAAQTLAALF
ncbi:hypothetical protein HDU96_002825 [Phlyctochytrium bullatum]|nr:hypothetical protein HDU96_002825 [Phlyctochytrium bullatum]